MSFSPSTADRNVTATNPNSATLTGIASATNVTIVVVASGSDGTSLISKPPMTRQIFGDGMYASYYHTM